MESLLAKDAILDLMTKMAYAQDGLDRALLKSLFVPDKKIFFDVSAHLPTYEPMQITPDELMDQVTTAIAGYTATQHLLANPLIALDSPGKPTKGNCKIQVCAYHCIEDEGKPLESVCARDIWDMDVEKWEGRWVITGIVIKRDVPMDNPALYNIAKQRTVRRKEKDAE
ncbi:hypothetical protein GQ53DRAFT_750671 [Thozetella sp. PMI_491]|nr:hypothetical protein GQ53DRAFT_750671 [Thozetella sp. PMI_491]